MYHPNMESGDLHFVVDGISNHAKLFNAKHELVWQCSAFPHGANGPSFKVVGGDTVPGYYALGRPQYLGNKHDLGNTPESQRDPDWRPFGWVAIPLTELENQEANLGRAGEMIHGGGSGCPDPWVPIQNLLYTHGCVRLHNEDVSHLALAFVDPVMDKGNKVYMSVQQTSA